MIIFILELYGIDTKSLIAGLGIVGAVIGLALQDTMKDIIGGISIIMENYLISIIIKLLLVKLHQIQFKVVLEYLVQVERMIKMHVVM